MENNIQQGSQIRNDQSKKSQINRRGNETNLIQGGILQDQNEVKNNANSDQNYQNTINQSEISQSEIINQINDRIQFNGQNDQQSQQLSQVVSISFGKQLHDYQLQRQSKQGNCVGKLLVVVLRQTDQPLQTQTLQPYDQQDQYPIVIVSQPPPQSNHAISTQVNSEVNKALLPPISQPNHAVADLPYPSERSLRNNLNLPPIERTGKNERCRSRSRRSGVNHQSRDSGQKDNLFGYVQQCINAYGKKNKKANSHNWKESDRDSNIDRQQNDSQSSSRNSRPTFRNQTPSISVRSISAMVLGSNAGKGGVDEILGINFERPSTELSNKFIVDDWGYQKVRKGYLTNGHQRQNSGDCEVDGRDCLGIHQIHGDNNHKTPSKLTTSGHQLPQHQSQLMQSNTVTAKAPSQFQNATYAKKVEQQYKTINRGQILTIILQLVVLVVVLENQLPLCGEIDFYEEKSNSYLERRLVQERGLVQKDGLAQKDGNQFNNSLKSTTVDNNQTIEIGQVNLNPPQKFRHNNTVLLLRLGLVISVLSSLCAFLRYKVRVILDQHHSSPLTTKLQLLVQLLILLLQPLQLTGPIVSRPRMSDERIQPLSSISWTQVLAIWSLIKVMILLRNLLDELVINSLSLNCLIYLSNSCRRLSKLYGSTYRYLGAIRGVYQDAPLTLTAFTFGLSVLILSYSMHIAQSSCSDSLLADYNNAVWLAIINMSTVGYGDIVPLTRMGRLLDSLCSYCGIVAVSMLIGSLNSYLQMNYRERRALRIMGRLKVKQEIRSHAEMLLREVLPRIWRKYKARKIVKVQHMERSRQQAMMALLLERLNQPQYIQARQYRLSQNSNLFDLMEANNDKQTITQQNEDEQDSGQLSSVSNQQRGSQSSEGEHGNNQVQQSLKSDDNNNKENIGYLEQSNMSSQQISQSGSIQQIKFIVKKQNSPTNIAHSRLNIIQRTHESESISSYSEVEISNEEMGTNNNMIRSPNEFAQFHNDQVREASIIPSFHERPSINRHQSLLNSRKSSQNMIPYKLSPTQSPQSSCSFSSTQTAPLISMPPKPIYHLQLKPSQKKIYRRLHHLIHQLRRTSTQSDSGVSTSRMSLFRSMQDMFESFQGHMEKVENSQKNFVSWIQSKLTDQEKSGEESQASQMCNMLMRGRVNNDGGRRQGCKAVGKTIDNNEGVQEISKII